MLRKDTLLDEWLVLRYRSGDSTAIKHLVKKWHKKIVMYIDYKIHNSQIAQDIAQECWVSVLNGLNRLKEPKKFGVWILSIAHNKTMDYLRSNIKKIEESKTDINKIVFYNEEHGDGGEELSNKLIKALEQISTSHKNVLKLFYLEGFSIAEISQITKIEKGTIKSQLHYARNALKKYLEAN